MQPDRLVWLTNIPTPYRTHFFAQLAQHASNQQVHVHAIFMAHTEPGRHWRISSDDLCFSHSFPPGISPMLGDRQFHLNPRALWALASAPPRWLLVSGSWYLPTAFLSAWLAKQRGTQVLFWNESNLHYVEHQGWLARWLRTMMLDSFDAYVVPGKWAKEYLWEYAPSSQQKPILKLPNVVSESRFRDGVQELRARRQSILETWQLEQAQRPIVFTAARLEPIKGILSLVNAVCDGNLLDRMTLLIAGEGGQRGQIQAAISGCGAERRIRLLGQLDEPGILDLLSISDAFILPSVGDPYPLAVIEASFAALPLLLSSRVGCHPEILVSGENGFLFDVTEPESIVTALRHFADLDPVGWESMGRCSLRRAEARFRTSAVIDEFLQSLLKL